MKDEIWKLQHVHEPKCTKGAVAMVSGVDDPTQLGIRDKLSASKELLDRVGLIKTEKSSSRGIRWCYDTTTKEGQWIEV